MHRIVAPLAMLAALSLVLATPTQAAQGRWSGMPDNPMETGFETMGYWGFGGRFGANLAAPVLDSVHLRFGASMTSAELRGDRLVGQSMNPFEMAYRMHDFVGYAAPAVDLDIWGPFELELTMGLAMVADGPPILEDGTAMAQEDDGPVLGVIGGPALRFDLEKDNPVCARIGVLAVSDIGWRYPRVMLDIGPSFTW